MNNIFNPNTTLIEAENIIYTYFQNTFEDHQITKSIQLSEDDTRHILHMLDNINANRLEDYEKIKLTIIVAWTYAIKYNLHNPSLKKSFLKRLYNLPQHHIRYYIDLFGSVFEEYSIMTFGHNYYSLNGIGAIVDIHANL
ncbi:MAG: hypothetical protein K2M73_09415 [Lachnospiraceae bacterium]|nr:hypothetical protein [Lachnospiraceae bacterium]MDE6697867.1 hypothetical protein [Lachnospiraceae bacterium]